MLESRFKLEPCVKLEPNGYDQTGTSNCYCSLDAQIDCQIFEGIPVFENFWREDPLRLRFYVSLVPASFCYFPWRNTLDGSYRQFVRVCRAGPQLSGIPGTPPTRPYHEFIQEDLVFKVQLRVLDASKSLYFLTYNWLQLTNCYFLCIHGDSIIKARFCDSRNWPIAVAIRCLYCYRCAVGKLPVRLKHVSTEKKFQFFFPTKYDDIGCILYVALKWIYVTPHQ